MRFLIALILLCIFSSILYAQDVSSACKPDYDANGKIVNDVIKFDTISDLNEWTLIKQLPIALGEVQSSFVLNNKLFVISRGQAYYDYPYLPNEVWATSDGRKWSLVSKLPGIYLGDYSVVVFKGKVFLIGGRTIMTSKNLPQAKFSVYYSSDGYSWKNYSLDFDPKVFPSTVVINDKGVEKLFLIGGVRLSGNLWTTPNYVSNQIHNSLDGFHWKEIKVSEKVFPPVYGHVAINFNNNIFTFGGTRYSDKDTPSTYQGDFFSSNGKQWKRIANKIKYGNSDKTGTGTVGLPTVFTFNGKIYLLGKYVPARNTQDYADYGTKIIGSLYSSVDGINWDKTNNLPIKGTVNGLSATVFNGRVYLFSYVEKLPPIGYKITYKTDVWVSESKHLVKVSSVGFFDDAFNVINPTGGRQLTGSFYLNGLGNNNFDKTFSLKEDSLKTGFQVAEYNHAVYPKTNYGNGGKVDLIQMSTNSLSKLFSYALSGYAGSYCSFGSKTAGVFDYPGLNSCDVKLKLNDQVLEKTVKSEYSFDDLVNLTYADEHTRCFKIKVA